MAKNLFARKGPLQGQCNICGSFGELTADHTPPKGCIRPGRAVLHNIVQRLSPGESTPRGKLFQNGVKYRSICAQCNNVHLGANHDRVLIDFSNSIANQLVSSSLATPFIYVTTYPQKLIRAVIGHICAQGEDRYNKGPLTEEFRDYFLDQTLPLPSGIRVYYWLFPFSNHVITRDSAYCDLRSGESAHFWLMKFYPIAFMVTWNASNKINFKVANFEAWRSTPVNIAANIPLLITPLIHPMWPEAPTYESIVMYGQEATVTHNSHKNAIV
jgi:hypothetical protein